AVYSDSRCHFQPLGAVGSATASQRLHLIPVVIRNSRSRAARQRRLALYQLSSKTCVTVPAIGSKVRIVVSISSILLAKGTPSPPLGLLPRPSLQLCSHLRLHLFPKMPQPALYHGCLCPWGFRQKATQSCQTRSIRNLLQQAREGSCSLTEHQSQQHSHEVLILRFREYLPKPLCKVADIFIQAYNGDRHWTPPWIQGWFFLPLIPHGVLSCYLPF